LASCTVLRCGGIGRLSVATAFNFYVPPDIILSQTPTTQAMKTKLYVLTSPNLIVKTLRGSHDTLEMPQ